MLPTLSGIFGIKYLLEENYPRRLNFVKFSVASLKLFG